MKTSAFKIIKSWLNKANFNRPKNYFNKYTIISVIVTVFAIIITTYFVRPIYFEYNENKKFLKNKIYNEFKLNIEIEGNISYKIFPTPRLVFNNSNLYFTKSDKNKINVKELYIPISLLSMKNLNYINLKKIVVQNQIIQVFPSSFKKYFTYLTLKKEKTILFKNSKIFFVDNQKNKVIFDTVSFNEKYLEKKHKINLSANFSTNKIEIEFLNRIGSKKYLKINVPNLKQYLDITFNESSSLDNLEGELKLKFLETLLLLNFKGKKNFEIYNSFLRNKFLNSKLNGNISFEDNFYFDLNLGVNQVNLRKLLLYYPIFQKGGVSKKINGKLNVTNKNTESLFGKIKDSKMTILFENGDIKIKKFSAKTTDDLKIISDISLLNNKTKPIIQFSLNFSTNNATKFLRKFGIYNFKQDTISFFINGIIDVNRKKIKFKEIIKDKNERIGNKEATILEKSFNTYVLEDGVLGVFDFFKIKKFVQENY